MNAATPLKQSSPTPASRMTLANVKRGKQAHAWRILLYGVEGVGKSTLAAATPSAIFLGAEDGTAHLDVERLPSPQSWIDIKAAVEVLLKEEHAYKTLVLDTVDWAEPLLWGFICARDKKADIEDYGYGKGYTAALDEWRVLLASLERLRETRKMNVLLLGHCHAKPFKNPLGEDFDRYELKLNIKAGGLLKEWCDAVLFANHETYAKKDERTKKVKGVSTGARWLYTERTAGYDAKNRYGFPEMLPLSWPDVEAAMQGNTDVAALLAEIRRKGAEFGQSQNVEGAIARIAGDVEKLKQLNTWCNSQITLMADSAGKKA
ncbi:MAG: ATP-binding protein [Rhodoglobus sp.]|nr:ATP-binding protein [Rhodoglobus sp.]